MNKTKSKHTLIIWFLGALSVLLITRLFVITVLQNEKWEKYVEDISQRTVYETAPRGDILDRNGKIIATSKPVYSVILSRLELTSENALQAASKVIGILEANDEDVAVTQQEIKANMKKSGYDSYLPILLAENISKQTAVEIKRQRLKGVQISTDYVRDYPYGPLAAHVIGYLGRISENEEKEYVEERGYRKDALIGKEGVEKVYENRLKGTDSTNLFQIDSRGIVRSSLGKNNGSKGEEIKLTIDLDTQETTENALQQAIEKASQGGTFESNYGDYQMTYAKNAAVGAAVVIKVDTGEVLAMASYPDFNPNDFTAAISQEKWASLQQANDKDPLSPSPLYNVAAMTAVQPGSTFKPVTALTALSCGLDRERYLYDDGYIALGGSTYGCFLWNDNGGKHGYLNLKDAIKVSCNYYFYDIACGYDFASGKSLGYNQNISNEKIFDFARALGLGEKTGIEINESAGIIPSKTLKIQEVKSSLRNYLLAESETYFEKSSLKNRTEIRKKIEKIVNWTDKDLTLDEIIGKLNGETFVKIDKIEDLASVCKYNYFDQAKWNQGDSFNISIGQGDNAYTTLQMANYMATLGNGGVRNKVVLVDKALVSKSQSSILSKDDINFVLEAMTSVTREREGSLYRAFANFPYLVAAKTGTAQRSGSINVEEEREHLRRHLHLIAPDVTFGAIEQEASRLMNEYPDIYESEDIALRRAVINLSDNDVTTEYMDRYKEKYDNFAWTIALAPADNPQIAVAVMLVQGKTSSNAAPVVREIIGEYGEKTGWEKLF